MSVSSSIWQSVHEGRIYQLKLFCDKDYPEKPPSVRFHSRINMSCVNHETGAVFSPPKCRCQVYLFCAGYSLWLIFIWCCDPIGWLEEVWCSSKLAARVHHGDYPYPAQEGDGNPAESQVGATSRRDVLLEEYLPPGSSPEFRFNIINLYLSGSRA